jgi:hypothetical protein
MQRATAICVSGGNDWSHITSKDAADAGGGASSALSLTVTPP